MLWLIVAVVIFAVSTYFIGLSDNVSDEKMLLFAGAFFLSLAWPVVLVLAVVAVPFYGFYLLGEYHRKKKEDSTENK